MLVCEAARYDVVLVETVGVGQSEVAVASMVDFFLVLMLAGAGDEAPRHQKGILELADCLAVNKADGDNVANAERAGRRIRERAAPLPSHERELGSARRHGERLARDRIDRVWAIIEEQPPHPLRRRRARGAGAATSSARVWNMIDEG